MSAVRPLAVSVLTSSSPWQLAELAYEVRRVHGDVWFDVLVPRLSHAPDPTLPADVTPTTLMSAAGRDKVEVELLDEQFRAAEGWNPRFVGGSVRVAALATYFPDLASSNGTRRETAVAALANAIRVGLRLAAADRIGRPREGGKARPVCVEAVCGTILDRYDKDGEKPLVGAQTRAVKFRWLCASLVKVFEQVEADFPPADHPFAVALEFEPGPSYLLNDLHALVDLNAALVDKGLPAASVELLKRHLGFNADIAHLRIAGVRAADFRRAVAERIVHAHIADHPPRMHTRDQPPGTWTSYDPDPEVVAFVHLLMERQAAFDADPTGLPFSGAIALELEGCPDPAHIHASIPAMRRILERAVG